MVFARRERGSERMARNIEAFFSERKRERPRESARIERSIESFFERGRRQQFL